ncbi:HIT family protein [Coralloluteibacterium stylophorae]|uniref:HIT family protein n=1 Tax=Coralloluteibacterium stylophorae TaxID=1776034 RepID=A0A8J7VUT6_9GAMM|nr:HIT family protein [Coralloluteibacterium stylophorae]MBS7458741.1 HIT family protein [Coralloluteibacterium stylophorae]
MSDGFALHPRLAADTHHVAALPLCDLLLMDDARYAWLILVPRVPGAGGIDELGFADRHALIDEVDLVSRLLRAETRPERINVGALGNLVPQLHVHVVARRRDDPAWPGPVWGHSSAQPYADAPREARLASLRAALGPRTRATE